MSQILKKIVVPSIFFPSPFKKDSGCPLHLVLLLTSLLLQIIAGILQPTVNED